MITDRLSTRAKVWVKEWNSGKVRKYKGLNPIIWGTGWPLAYLPSVMLLSITTTLACWGLPSCFGINLAQYEKSWDFLSYFGTLWTLQATLAALVYPIVISFVAVLFQRRTSSGFGLKLYLNDAAVMPAGVGALALVLIMAAQYMLLPYVSSDVLAAIVAGDSVWFISNTLLTIWFLYRTIKFLNEAFRLKTYERHLIDVLLPSDVHHNLLGLMFTNGVKDGLLPGKDMECITLYPINIGVPSISVSTRPGLVVSDVRLRLLRWAIMLWLRQVRRERNKESVDPIFGNADRPALIFPIQIGHGSSTDQQILCRVNGGVPLSKLSSLLIRHSVVLKESNYETIIGCKDVLEELVHEVMAFLETNRVEAASEYLLSIVDMHAALIKAGAFINGEGKADNAAMLFKPYAWGGQRFHEEWIRSYDPLINLVVTDIQLYERIFARCCYLPYSLIGRIRDQQFEIIVGALQPAEYLMYRLADWWSLQVVDRHAVEPGPNHGVFLDSRSRMSYDRAMKKFVEGWEAVSLYKSDLPVSNGERWEYLSKKTRFHAAQLESLGALLVSAIARGDRSAALWLNDSFLHWWQANQHEYQNHHDFNSEFESLSVSSLRLTWEELLIEFPALQQGGNHFSLMSRLLSIAIYRYWNDLRTLIALTLLHWTIATNSEESFSLQFAAAQLFNINLRTDGGTRNDSITNGRLVFERLLKLELLGGDYWHVLDGYSERINRLREREVISGRTYSIHGSRGIGMLRKAILLLTLSLSQNRGPWESTPTNVCQWCDSDASRLRDASFKLDEYAAVATSSDFRESLYICEELRRLSNTDSRVQMAEFSEIIVELPILVRQRQAND